VSASKPSESKPPEAAPRRAVVPRHAASLLVVRRAGGKASVLMGLRGAKHRFLPNRLVFPGGGVDRADYRVRPASTLAPEVLRRLERAAKPGLARALAVAAARELHEETGLTLGHPPHLEGLDYLCRAVTPPALPIRFNARFFVVDEARVSGELAGSGELEQLRFFPLDEALGLDVVLATRFVLERLVEWLALSEAERRARTHTALLRNRAGEVE